LLNDLSALTTKGKKGENPGATRLFMWFFWLNIYSFISKEHNVSRRPTLSSDEISGWLLIDVLVLERITGGDGDQMASNAPLGHVGFLGHPYLFHVALSSSLHVHSFLFFID
jgi:hypothetical protein